MTQETQHLLNFFDLTKNFKLQEEKNMVFPLPLLPFAISTGAAAWNGIVNAFNGASGRTMQKNLEGQRLVHQKELQEKQIVAQLKTEYMRTMTQVKLQQNNQEFQLDLQRNNQEFQRELESQRFDHQNELQEKQIAAQFDLENYRQ